MAGEIPTELTSRPLTYVAVYGLDSSPPHTSIWNILSINRKTERAPLHLSLLDMDHVYPEPKPKRTSYEWYVPKGLLKTNWLDKHLYQVPAVAVLFFELDWDSPQWAEKKAQCCALIEKIRTNLKGRSTRVALVLIQKTTPLPGSEDLVAKERAAALCSTCDLSAKSLFVLPISDHLEGYILRLENAFFELALNYYHQEIKYVRNHKDHLNKTTHQNLFVRHAFKIAFYNELKQDLPSAVKHYKLAYGHILEIRPTDANIMELKTVAGFLSYKVCHLFFVTNVPLDAISQFRHHIETFKSKQGPKELQFEHHDWLAMQFHHFGQLFREAVQLGLSAIQTQHPGFYFQQAAASAQARKAHALSLALPPAPTEDLLTPARPPDYYGQRPWRPAIQNMDMIDPKKEAQAIQALQHRELTQVNHSDIIIHFLEKAIVQFHLYRCPRMKRYLKVQMGEEYLFCHKYPQSLENFKEVLHEMRGENWKPIVSSILQNGIRAAFMAARIEDFLQLGFDFISSWNDCPSEDKILVQAGIAQILKGQPPVPIPGVSVEEEVWESQLRTPAHPTVHLSPSPRSCIHCQAGFTQPSVSRDSPVVLSLWITVDCPTPLAVSHINLLLSNRSYECAMVPTEPLQPSRNYHFQCQLRPQQEERLLVQGVNLKLAGHPGRQAVLQVPAHPQPPTGCHSSLLVGPRPARLTMTPYHNNPLLAHETYPVMVALSSMETTPLTDLSMSVAQLSPTNVELVSGEKLSVPELAPGDTVEHTLQVTTAHTGLHHILLQVSYAVQLEEGGPACRCLATLPLELMSVEPLSFSVSYLNLKFEGVREVKAGQPFLVRVQAVSQTSVPLVMDAISLQLNAPFLQLEGGTNLKGVLLQEGGAACELFICQSERAFDTTVEPGVATLTWRRKSQKEDSPLQSSQVPLPPVGVGWSPLCVSLHAPSHGWVRTPLALGFTLLNTSPQVQDLEVRLHTSDAFMFSGDKQMNLRLLPHEGRSVRYNLYPLVAGFVPLPQLEVVCLNTGVARPLQLGDSLPSSMFILPQGKSDTGLLAAAAH